MHDSQGAFMLAGVFVQLYCVLELKIPALLRTSDGEHKL